MSLFDYLTCKMPPPDPHPEGEVQFLTRDTDAQLCEEYTITADGRLIHHTVRYEAPRKTLPQTRWSRNRS